VLGFLPIAANYREATATRKALQGWKPKSWHNQITIGADMPTELHDKAHIDVFDRAAREHWALRFGVTEERLRKAVRMVGSRVTSVAAYLGQAAQ
jgi:hypothetical protein